MLSVEAAVERAADLVARARRAGADAADAVYAMQAGTSVSVRLGALEDVGRAESASIGLRVFAGQRSATTSTSDFSLAALDALVERTLAMARAAPEDRYAGLAPEDLLARGPFTDFESDDGVAVEPEALRASALAAEAAARAVPGVTNSQGAGASAGRSVSAIATSHGFAGGHARSHHAVSASVLAGSEGAQERDYAHHSTVHRADLDPAEKIGREAGERAVARVGAVRLASGAMPVVFDPRVASSLLGHFAGAISGAAVARGTSFLRDRRGDRIFAPGVAIVDDPHRPRGLRSRAFDGEGLPTRLVRLVDDGVLAGWIAEAASARQLGMAPTGHAARGVSGAPGASTSNLYLAPGAMSPAALMADIVDGFYVTELIGMGVDGVTGDYSRGASGRRIVGGQLAEAVSEVTIAGNLIAMFARLVPANDLVFRHAVNAPTVRIDGMTVAGG